MKSDEQLTLEALAEYWNDPKFLSDEYPEPQYDDSQVALVRAGREAVLKQVVEREGLCEWGCTTFDPDQCLRCWATAMLKEIDDATTKTT